MIFVLKSIELPRKKIFKKNLGPKTPKNQLFLKNLENQKPKISELYNTTKVTVCPKKI
jgi:hypothetical protein